MPHCHGLYKVVELHITELHHLLPACGPVSGTCMLAQPAKPQVDTRPQSPLLSLQEEEERAAAEAAKTNGTASNGTSAATAEAVDAMRKVLVKTKSAGKVSEALRGLQIEGGPAGMMRVLYEVSTLLQAGCSRQDGGSGHHVCSDCSHGRVRLAAQQCDLGCQHNVSAA